MMQSKEGIIYFPVLVPAGFPSPATDYTQERIDLNKHLKGNSPSTFIIRVQGDSMIGAHITDESLLVVDKALQAKHNSIVVAVVNGEWTIKRLSMIDGKVHLVPANSKYKPIEITEETQFQVWGVVTNIIINIKQFQ